MKREMKKGLIRVLALALCLALTGTAALAEAISLGVIGGADGPTQVVVTQTSAASETPEISVQANVSKSGVQVTELSYGYGAACVGGDLYLLNDNMLLRLAAGETAFECIAQYEGYYRYRGLADLEAMDAQERELANKTPDRIFEDGGRLCGLSSFTGMYGPIGADGMIENAVALDWSQMYTETGVRDIQNALVADGVLYAQLAPQYAPDGYSHDDLRTTRFDLTSGEAKELDLTGECAMTGYKDGKLLVCASYGADEDGVWVFDPLTGEMGETLVPYEGYGEDAVEGITYNSGGIAYDAATDTVYFVQNSRIYAYANGTRTEAAFIPVDYASNIQQAHIIGERYFCTEWDGVYLYSLRAEDQPERSIRISGSYANDTTRAYTQETGVPVLFDSKWHSSAESVRNDMIAGTGNDIYVISVDSGARDLIEKGYVQPLDESQLLTQDAARLYAPIYDAVTMDGTLYAVPQSMSASLWSVNPQVWELFDLGDYPSTFKGYVELIDTWYADYAEDNPDYAVMSLYNSKDELFGQALQQYIYQYERPDEPLSFNTDVFRETMQAIENLEIEEIDWANLSAEEQEEIWEKNSRPTLLEMNAYETVEVATTFYSTPDGNYEEAPIQILLPPSFEEGKSSVMPASLTLYIVNPESENIDLAIDYLEYWVEHADAALRYEIHTDLSEPVRQQHYEESRAYYVEWIADIEAAMESASEADRQSYQETLDWVRAELEELDATSWRISDESIANYRVLAEQMVIPLDSLFLSGDSAALSVLQDVFMRYLDGQINLDAFIREADQKIRMVYLENM